MSQYPPQNIPLMSTVPVEPDVSYQREEYRERDCNIPERDHSCNLGDHYGSHEKKRSRYDDEIKAR